jgi:heat shock protein HtpX
MFCSFLLIFSIYPSCFTHRFSMGTSTPVHIICKNQTFAFISLLCTSWVTLNGILFLTAGALGVLSFYLGGWTVRRLNGYQEVEEEELGELYNGINEISEKAAIRTPRIFLIESSSPQMFSHGGYGNPSIFISVGLLETLSKGEVLASVGHEIAHLKNRDTLMRSIAVSLKIASMFNPVGVLLESLLARDREFLADEEGAKLSGRPWGLISALAKLSQVITSGDNENFTGNLLISLFMPRNYKWRVLSRHPSLEERIRRLLDFAHSVSCTR